MKMVKCLPEFEYFFFTVFLKNRVFISKIRILKVTDYAALNGLSIFKYQSSAATCTSNFKLGKRNS